MFAEVQQEQGQWPILGRAKARSMWIMWSVQDMRDPWQTALSRTLGRTTAATARTQGSSVTTSARKSLGTATKVRPCPEGHNNSSRWATVMLGRERFNNSTSQRKQLYQKQLQKRRGRNPLCLHYVSLFFAAAQRKHQDLNQYRASVTMVCSSHVH